MKMSFTAEAEKAINKGAKFAAKLGSHMMSSEHLLYGLGASSGVAATILKENGLDRETLQFEIENYCGKTNTATVSSVEADMSPKLEELILAAEEEAEHLGSEKVGTEHLMIAILMDTTSVAYRILMAIGANIQKIYIEMMVTLGADLNMAKNELIASRNKTRQSKGTPVLDQYGRDLNEYAKEGKIDPVICREDEIASVLEILCRRTKNNPCLIGEPGVGKTAIAEGLAARIVEGKVPEMIRDKRVITLDLSGMVAGSKYRGEFEERMKRALRETRAEGNILLFIDEIHTVIGAGGAEGAIDASNILKPALARGEVQVIGATTRDEYRKHVEKDAALERRFQPVVVEEPTSAQTVEMLQGLRERYEDYHQITITDEAIEAAVRLSVRYINDRFLPDKAIDLIDEAAARFRLQQLVDKKESTLDKLEQRKEELYAEKEQALIAGDMELVRSIRQTEIANDEMIVKERKKQNRKKNKKRPELQESHIAEIVARWTHIPVQRVAQEEMSRLKKLETILHKRVVGQSEAVEAVSKAIRRGRVGLKDPKRPIGSFLFLGPTGVGKTELSKALAEAVFGSEKDMIRVDMSEYMEQASVSKMIGSAPGYVGYEEGGQISEKVRQKPYSVLLFDEIEKAHPDVFNMLLQVLDDGHITDAKGRQVDFKNTIIIMTSNAGANRIISPKKLGFGQAQSQEEEHKKMKEGVMEEVRHIFKPEFINRIDEMIVFHALNEEDIHEVTKIMVDSFCKRVQEQMNIKLTVTKDVVDFVAKKGFDKDYGARPIRRALQSQVEDALAQAVVDGEVHMGDEVRIRMKKQGEEQHVFVQKIQKKQ